MTRLNQIKKIAISSALVLGPRSFAYSAPHVPGELLVKLKETSNKLELFKTYQAVGASVEETINSSFGQIQRLSFDKQKSSLVKIQEILKTDSSIEIVEPNFIYSIITPTKSKKKINIETLISPSYESNIQNSSTPRDPRFGELWGLHNTGSNIPTFSSKNTGIDINALKAWKLSTGSRKIKIAVIDTGIDYNHPDLQENIWKNTAELNGKEGVDDDGNGYIDDIYGYDFANDDSDPMDGHGHGTHCSGTIGAVHDNGIGVAGVMPNVSLVGVKFLTDRGSGTLAGAIKAIDYSSQLDVDIMSNSWGGGGASDLLKKAIENASKNGIIFTAAAGNSASNNDERPHYPSNYKVRNVISVAAHTIEDELANFSCYGRKSVHIAAPGNKILSTVQGGAYKVFSGTSMATPHVSGALGLLLAENGRMDHDILKEKLLNTSVPVSKYLRKTISGGRLDAYNLLSNTRPERQRPNPKEWKTVLLDEVWESTHPYLANYNESKTFTINDAKYMRIKVKKFDIEKKYDYLKIRGNSREVIEKISGKGEGFVSDYIIGNTINATFSSDRSVTKWGFLVEEIQWQ